MKSISVQNLNGLFNFIEELSSTVLWIRDITWQKQIYVSSNYETIWKHSLEEIYNFPQSFYETIFHEDSHIAEDAKNIETRLKDNTHDDRIFLYRAQTTDNKIIYIKDWHYILTNNENMPLGFLGFAKKIQEDEWHNDTKNNIQKNDSSKKIQHNILALLKKELNWQSKVNPADAKQPPNFIDSINLAISKQDIKLTPQEISCLSLVLQGTLSKQIASTMNISPRTVEFHLENIRRKFGSRTKIQLISKILTYS